MGSNFTVFESAVSALGTNTQALSVAGNNIANVNTPGYSRQRITIMPRTPQSAGGIEIGLGVTVKEITRTYDRFAELRLQESASEKARYDSLASNIQQVETAFNELNRDGLTKAISDLYNGFHDLANDPTSISSRNNILNQATILVDRFHSLNNYLSRSQTLIDGDVKELVDRANTLAHEIGDLNTQIQSAPDGADLTLRDQRQLKVRELSEIIDISTVETSDGVFQVYMSGGFQLVNGPSTGTLGIDSDPDTGLSAVTFAIGTGSPSDISARISSGSLKGLIDARDTYIPSYAAQLDELAYQIINQTNLTHSSGYDLDGNTLIEFFDEDSLNTEAATGTDLLTNLKDGNGAHMRVEVGDVITLTGSVGVDALNSTLTVSATTSLSDVASFLQAALRAQGDGSELATVRPDGSIRLTSGAGDALTNIQLTIPGKANFNTAFDFPTPIALGGATGDSDTILDTLSTGAARLISLDSTVDGHPRAVAASATSGGLPGDNTNALILANIQRDEISFSTGDSTLVNFFGKLLSQIGSDSESFINRSTFAEEVYNQAEIQREKISGVSIEEEQLNIVRYQSAFTAASRLVQVVSDVLETLANLG